MDMSQVIVCLCSVIITGLLAIAHAQESINAPPLDGVPVVAGDGDRKNLLHDPDHVRHAGHIKDHLDGVIEAPLETMSNEEVQFHYFQLHDYDKNSKLDGLELAAAMSHQHKEGGDDNNVVGWSDNDISALVDSILEEDDKNNDGYVDYTEFVMSQQGSN